MSTIAAAGPPGGRGDDLMQRQSLVIMLKQVLQYAGYAYMNEPPSNTAFQHYKRVVVGGSYQVPIVIFKPTGEKVVISIQGTDISQHRHVYLDSKLALASSHGTTVHDAVVQRICNDIVMELKNIHRLFNDVTSIEVVGHSLGGYLAQRLSMFGHLQNHKCQVRCWAVDSPGLMPSDLAGLSSYEKQALKGHHFAIMCWPNAVNTLGSHECNTLIHAAYRPTHMKPVFMCDHRTSQGLDTAARVTEFVSFFSETASRVVKQATQGYLRIGSMVVALRAFYERAVSHSIGVICKAIEEGDVYHMHTWPQLNPGDVFEEVIKSMFDEPLTFSYIKKLFFQPSDFEVYTFLAAFCTKMQGYQRCDCRENAHLFEVLMADVFDA